MTDQIDATSLEHRRKDLLSSARLIAMGRDGFKDAAAGLVSAIVLIANIISFGALMFPGQLSSGIPIAIWAMLIGCSIGGVWIALMTSIPPIATGIDSPTGAVLVLLSASAGSGVISAGGSPELAVQTVMLIFSAATLLSGVLLYGLGAFHCGSYFRFVPYFVVGGFLAATGWLLIAGGVRIASGHVVTLDILNAGWSLAEILRLAAAVSVFAALLAIRHWIKWTFAIPVGLVAMCLSVALALKVLGLSGNEHGWYLPSLGVLTIWSPLEAAHTSPMTWRTLVGLAPQMLAVTIVALISLVAKLSGMEVARQVSGDLDRELRSHGLASIVATPFGGIIGGMQNGASRLLEHAGGATRVSGVMSALVLGVVALVNLDLPGLVPIPVVAGLVFFLGYTFMMDAVGKPISQRAWLDLSLAIAIMIVCVRYGYVIGVITGIVCACVMFAFSYARFGVVRRYMTRAAFASHVDRSVVASGYLRENGDFIQIYWLSGYIFFGSSEGLFERISNDIRARPARRVAYLILDFGSVSGADSSAVVSFTKLRNFCDRRGVIMVFCSLSAANRAVMEAGGFFGSKSKHQMFDDLPLGLAWCEDQVLAQADLGTDTSIAGFAPWLQEQLGPGVNAADIIGYLEIKHTEDSEVLYREGEPADRIDLVATGNLVVDIVKNDGERLRIRRITTHFVVGEMGFFRRSVRSATVSSDGPATLYTLTRANFERMRSERPDLADAFYDFIIRVLADRVDFATHAVAALSA